MASASATVPPATSAWTNKAVALTATASATATPQVHLGANFPLTLTSQSTMVDGSTWVEAAWQTPGRKGTGWLPESAVVDTKPTGTATASFDALDTELAEYMAGYGERVGVDVVDVIRGITYTHNADKSYYVASSVKVAIMLTLLSQLEARRKSPTAKQVSLLTTMIENSNNDSATELYKEIGWQRGINTFMKKVGITGLKPATPEVGWGLSTITPQAMVALLGRLHAGTVLNATNRKLALDLMRHVDAAGRPGVGDSSPAGAIVELKDGWYGPIDDPSGPWVVNSSGIVTLGAETYIISVYTDGDNSTSAGLAIVRHICKIVGQRLTGTN
jgi:beta-lactamase class A